MTHLRLLFVTRRYWPQVGGSQVTLARLAAGLAARAVQVSVYAPRWLPEWPAEVIHEGVRIFRGPRPHDGAWGTVRRAQTLAAWLKARRGQFDAVFVEGLRHDAYIVQRESRHGGYRVVLRPTRTGLAGDCFWQLGAYFGRRIKRACQRTDALVAWTQGAERELIAAGYPRERIHHLPSGVPLPSATTSDTRLAARRALARAQPALEIADDAPLVVWTGRLQPAAGLERLIDAWPAVAGRKRHARLWVVGEGPCHARLAALTRDRGVEGSVVLPGAFDQVDEFLQAADAYACPTADEGSCAGLLEALAAGLPAAVSDIPGHRAVVEHDAQALLVGEEDTAALAAALLRLLENRSLAQHLAQAAQCRIAEMFTLDRMVESHLALFQSINHG